MPAPQSTLIQTAPVSEPPLASSVEQTPTNPLLSASDPAHRAGLLSSTFHHLSKLRLFNYAAPSHVASAPAEAHGDEGGHDQREKSHGDEPSPPSPSSPAAMMLDGYPASAGPFPNPRTRNHVRG